MSATWRICLFGSLSVQRDGQLITRFKSQKVGALLAYLAFYRQMHAREVLIDLFWPSSTLDEGRNSLSVALSSLRHQLEPPGTLAGAALRADRFAVGLNPETVRTDTGAFEDTLKEALHADSQTERLQTLIRALALYQGRLLPGFYEGWIVPEQERLAGLFSDAAYELLGLLVSLGQPAAALRHYRELERFLDGRRGDDTALSMRALVRQIEAQSDASVSPSAAPVVTLPGPAALPPGVPRTVNLLLGDLRLPEQGDPRGKASAVQEIYHRLVRPAIPRHRGQAIQETGDSFLALFPSPMDALACAVALQQATTGRDGGAVSVRMAVHTGDIEMADGVYTGQALYRASRMLTAARGGQILVSEVTASLLRRDLAADVLLVDLGVWRLHDLPDPERLYQVEYPGMPTPEAGALSADAGYQLHLPITVTRFFGRERELERLREWLAPAGEGGIRLLTLTGPAGTGKTRLALETARRFHVVFQEAVWFVGLAALADPRHLPGAIQEALQLPASPRNPLEQVVEALSRQPTLLLLDNFEHLIVDGVAVVQTLLERVPTLTCLVTSRQILGLSSEHVFPVPPLPTPEGVATPERLSRCDSVRLFVDRAQAVMPHFQLTEHNAAAVAELCTRLEGIPLAIELAAARALVLTPGQILTQWTHRFDLLVSRRRDIAERHRSLHAAVDWSYRLLSPDLQRFFAQLSVFRGGWSGEAAEAVCEQPLALDFLEQLRECSMVVAEETAAGMRFGMLETLREFAREQLTPDQDAPLRRRHAEFVLTIVERNEKPIQLDVELDNVRAALEWGGTTQEDAAIRLRLAAAAANFWCVRGHWSEGRRYLVDALACTDAGESAEVRGWALFRAGQLAQFQNDLAAARPLLEKALEVGRATGDLAITTDSLDYLGEVARGHGDYAAAARLFWESLKMRTEAGDLEQMALSYLWLGCLRYEQGALTRARAWFQKCLAADQEVRRSGGTSLWTSLASVFLGSIAWYAGDPISARALLIEGLEMLEEIGAISRYEQALLMLGRLEATQGDDASAQTRYRKSLQGAEECGDWQTVAQALEAYAGLASARGQAERAGRLLGAATALREATGCLLWPVERADFERNVAMARTALGENAFALAWKTGRAMTQAEAIALALQT